MTKCRLCNKKFEIITNTHLKSVHGWKLKKYTKKFGTKNCGFLTPNLLPKNDLRYIKWKKSLKKRPPTWCKGFTKETHMSVAKISETFKRKKIDNFRKWRREAIKKGLFRPNHPRFKQSEDLAELIGLVLGDGNLFKHERTECLTISFNAKYQEIIRRGHHLIKKIFQKEPTRDQNKKATCVRLRIYQKDIGKRLGIPCGAKKNYELKIPKWVWRSKKLLRACLIGLFNAEGSYSVHLPTCTYNLQFSNTNQSLLQDVHQALQVLGYHSNLREKAVCLRRREEAIRFVKEIKFQEYRS